MGGDDLTVLTVFSRDPATAPSHGQVIFHIIQEDSGVLS